MSESAVVAWRGVRVGFCMKRVWTCKAIGVSGKSWVGGIDGAKGVGVETSQRVSFIDLGEALWMDVLSTDLCTLDEFTNFRWNYNQPCNWDYCM